MTGLPETEDNTSTEQPADGDEHVKPTELPRPAQELLATSKPGPTQQSQSTTQPNPKSTQTQVFGKEQDAAIKAASAELLDSSKNSVQKRANEAPNTPVIAETPTSTELLGTSKTLLAAELPNTWKKSEGSNEDNEDNRGALQQSPVTKILDALPKREATGRPDGMEVERDAADAAMEPSPVATAAKVAAVPTGTPSAVADIAPVESTSSGPSTKPAAQAPGKLVSAPPSVPVLTNSPMPFRPIPPQLSRALQIAALISSFLGPNHPSPQNAQLPTLNALRARLTSQPAYYDANPDHLAWQVREAIRTEFFKVLYPNPPPNPLLALVTSTESLLAPFPPRPFFFPGARVAVPTEAGSRRAATSLQLRFKQVASSTVAEALLHLDGPDGGGFQWVQAPALTPLSLYAPQRIQKKKVRASSGVKQRRKREKVMPPPPPPIPPRSVPPTMTPSSGVTSVTPATRATAEAPSTNVASSAAGAGPLAGASGVLATATGTTTGSAGVPTTKPPNVTARLARQDASGVYVPDALRGTSPPPRKRIIGEGRFVTHVSGAMRRAGELDVGNLLGIERLVARRDTENVEYFVKWGGVPMREGSWESRDALMQDVPGLVRDFDVRHPQRKRDRLPRSIKMENGETRSQSQSQRKEKSSVADEGFEENGAGLFKQESVSGENEKDDGMKDQGTTSVRQYTDDVTGLLIPSWLDTPIVELNICGMVLQIRRPNEAILHNDATSAVRDAKKRQTRLKQEDLALGERLFPLTKPEAKAVIDAAAKDHRFHNRFPIVFPRGLGRVSPVDHGDAFSSMDALTAPASWEGYLLHIGLRCRDYTRALPPHMPTVMEGERGQGRLQRAGEDLAFSKACEHRERARVLLRESFRHTGAPPPRHIFRDGIRAPPGTTEHAASPREAGVGSSDNGQARGLLRARDEVIDRAVKKSRKVVPKDRGGFWFDDVWSCWRPSST